MTMRSRIKVLFLQFFCASAFTGPSSSVSLTLTKSSRMQFEYEDASSTTMTTA
eukprot:CAMPEP_0197233568 /NCGR_PEP_ID=MMETSP1429-20130617/1596_1 /TAXON_ID=49237 /ORGANISM="Chaetoceros  sp., Strain UNC1202" /LENGTH=52 /DNA_ID=CAMNT_0042691831 /DNA_START=45 /DNA_END=199 /DNA_ORIENTATION=-